jgi:hypothetical protein
LNLQVFQVTHSTLIVPYPFSSPEVAGIHQKVERENFYTFCPSPSFLKAILGMLTLDRNALR